MTESVVSSRPRHLLPMRHAVRAIGAAAALTLASASPTAQAAVLYTPVCVICSVGNMPAQGDELVVRGLVVSFAGGNLSSAGVLTNTAFSLSNAGQLHVQGGFNNNRRLSNSGTLIVAGDASPTFTNRLQFSNSGTVAVYTTLTNEAGLLVNGGTFQVNGGHITNQGGATFTNNGNATLALTEGRFTNLAGAVFNNHGTVNGNMGSTFVNQGALNNRSGSFQVGVLRNQGVLSNSAGATLHAGSNLVNEAGGRLVNRGVIAVGADRRLILDQGSTYDLQGGTINVGTLGHLYLHRDFTMGAAQAGQINLASGGRIHNTATLRVTNTQTTQGDVSNQGALVNQGTWRSQGAINSSGTLTNSGQFIAEGGVNAAAFTQNAGKTTVSSEVVLGQASVQGGSVEVTQGGALVAETLSLNGALVAHGGVLHLGSLQVGQQGWLDLLDAPLMIRGDFIDRSQVAANWQTADASLSFLGEGLHRFEVGVGSSRWAQLTLDAAGSYEFLGGQSLFVGAFAIEGGDLSLLSAISGDLTIYYDPTLQANAYLNGQSYSFGLGGGQLIAAGSEVFAMAASVSVTAVPEAEHWALALAGLSVLGLRGLRARRKGQSA